MKKGASRPFLHLISGVLAQKAEDFVGNASPPFGQILRRHGIAGAAHHVDGVAGLRFEGKIGKVEAGGLHGHTAYYRDAYAVHAHTGAGGRVAAIAVGIAYGRPADEPVGLCGIREAVAQTFALAERVDADERNGHAHDGQEAFAASGTRRTEQWIIAVDGKAGAADIARKRGMAHESGTVAQRAEHIGVLAAQDIGGLEEAFGLKRGEAVVFRLVGHSQMRKEKDGTQGLIGAQEGGHVFHFFRQEAQTGHAGIHLQSDVEALRLFGAQSRVHSLEACPVVDQGNDMLFSCEADVFRAEREAEKGNDIAAVAVFANQLSFFQSADGGPFYAQFSKDIRGGKDAVTVGVRFDDGHEGLALAHQQAEIMTEIVPVDMDMTGRRYHFNSGPLPDSCGVRAPRGLFFRNIVCYGNRVFGRCPNGASVFLFPSFGSTSSFSDLQPGIAVFFSIVFSSAFRRAVAAVCCVLICLCSMPMEASAGFLDMQKSMNTKGEAPWTLKSDKLVSIDDGVIMEASGGVLLQRGDDYMKADFARYYTATNWIFVQGNVEVRMGRDLLNAEEAEFDLNARTGWLKNGSIFMAGPHMYVSGSQVDKLFGDRYAFKNAKITLCDGERPAWSVSAKNAEVEIDGYATLHHTTLNILDVPVMDAPFMMLPAKTSRQSGLLFPDMGYSSLVGGFYSQPYFHVIDDSRDLTFYATYMGRSGFMPGIEYRAHTRKEDKTWLAFDFLSDRHTFRTEGGDRVNASDGKVNTNEERFWLRGMGEGYVGDSQWRYRYNLDYVSDQNYLREFRSMMNGFSKSRDALYEMFGRDIAEVDENRVSEGFLYREWDKFMVTAGFRYEELPHLGHGNDKHRNDTTVQSIPLNAYLFRTRVVDALPLEIQGAVSATYAYRNAGVRGMRTEIHPELSLPVNLPGMSLILNGGLRQTWYNSTHYHKLTTDKATRGGGTKDRFIPEASVTAFTQFSRVWQMPERALEATEENLGESRWVGLTHRVQPRVIYGWVPDRDQSENPIFDAMDRIKPSQQVQFSVLNIFTTKKSTVKKDKNGYSLSESFSDPIRWELATGYDLEEAERSKYRDEFDRKPVMDTYSYLQISPLDWFALSNKMYISMYGDGVTRTDTGVTFFNERWGSWSISYDVRNKHYNYREEMKRDKRSDINFTSTRRLLTNTLKLKLTSKLDLYFRTEDDVFNGHNLAWESVLGYRHQCFHILGALERDGRDTAFRVYLQFPGFNL